MRHKATQHTDESDPSARLAEAANAFLLGVYRCAVESYQPRIERRTGVQLGKIDVWDYSQLHRHIACDIEEPRMSLLLFGFLKSLVLEWRVRKRSRQLIGAYEDHARKYAACYYADAIYVSFAASTPHDEVAPVVAVHELSHALWERLEGEPFHAKRLPPADQEKYQLLVEGYAVYAASTWFLDFYPACIRNNLPYAQYDRASVYYRGFKRIRELVELFGPHVLLRIPSEWRNY